ncbi:MAG TPA: hypothetical protein VHE30_22110 [Polyangiaceae bacterium]|nr:hypothetical protein [Polyangiaceae bacterium]
MWMRLVFALVKGGLGGFVGAAVAAVLGGKVPAAAYAGAAFTGVVTGLLAGRPVWAEGGRREAAVKVPAGVFLALATLFGFRKWLSAVTVGASVPLGDAPFVALPLLAVAIALVLEVDDEFGADAFVAGPRAEAPGTTPAADPGAPVAPSGKNPNADGN